MSKELNNLKLDALSISSGEEVVTNFKVGDVIYNILLVIERYLDGAPEQNSPGAPGLERYSEPSLVQDGLPEVVRGRTSYWKTGDGSQLVFNNGTLLFETDNLGQAIGFKMANGIGVYNQLDYLINPDEREANAMYTSGNFDVDLASKTSDDIREGGTNKYMYNEEKIKLAGIEPGATGDLTAREVESLYESLPNTNKFSDGFINEINRLSGLASSFILNTDARLTNERVPIDNSVTSTKIPDGSVEEAKLSQLVRDKLNATGGSGGGTSYNTSSFNIDFSTKTTDDLAQGDNRLYITSSEKAKLASIPSNISASLGNKEDVGVAASLTSALRTDLEGQLDDKVDDQDPRMFDERVPPNNTVTAQKIVDSTITESKLHPAVRTKLNSGGGSGVGTGAPPPEVLFGTQKVLSNLDSLKTFYYEGSSEYKIILDDSIDASVFQVAFMVYDSEGSIFLELDGVNSIGVDGNYLVGKEGGGPALGFILPTTTDNQFYLSGDWVMNSAPVANPVVQGTFAQGSVLTADINYSDAEGDPEGAHQYQWVRADNSQGLNKQNISGAQFQTYSPTNLDAGKYLAVEVVPKALSGKNSDTVYRSSYRSEPALGGFTVLVDLARYNGSTTDNGWNLCNHGDENVPGIGATEASPVMLSNDLLTQDGDPTGIGIGIIDAFQRGSEQSAGTSYGGFTESVLSKNIYLYDSDDEGILRLYNLPAGSYTIKSTGQSTQASAITSVTIKGSTLQYDAATGGVAQHSFTIGSTEDIDIIVRRVGDGVFGFIAGLIIERN